MKTKLFSLLTILSRVLDFNHTEGYFNYQNAGNQRYSVLIKSYFFKVLLLISFFPNLMISQTWSRLGANKFPTDPNHLMDQFWGGTGLGTRNIGNAQIVSIWIDPTNANHVLIGTFGGGIYETFDALSETLTSIHWEPKTQNLPVHFVSKIIKHNGILYAGSGFYLNASNLYYSNAKESRNLYGLGVIKSSDNGATWQISSMPDPQKGFFCSDFTVPSSSGIMYAASKHRVYKSTDYGSTWTDLNIGFTQEGAYNKIIIGIATNPTDPNIVFVSTVSGIIGEEKVFKSSNGGASWVGLGTIFNYATISSYNTSGDNTALYVNGNDLYISFSKGNNGYTTVIKSSDWTNFTVVGNYNTPSSYSTLNYVKAFNKNFLYGMTALVEIGSTNNTNLTYAKTHDDIRSVDFVSANGYDYIFTGHDGGISRSKDGGTTWQNIMGDLNIPLINNLGYYTDPTDRAFDIGCQDTGWYRNEITTPPSESFVTKAYEGAVYTSPHNKRIYFENGFYTENNGLSYQAFPGGHRGMIEDPLDFNIRYHPSYTNQFYVYDNNASSSNLFPGFANAPAGSDNIGIQSKVALNSNKNILLPIMYFSSGIVYNTKHGLIFSKDRGLSWEDVGMNIKNADVGLPDIMNYPGAMLTCVTMDDYHPNRMWVVFAGSGLINQKVYQSNDYGKTWQNISYNLSNVSSLGLPSNTPSNYPVNQIEYDENRDILFIGTDYGLFYLDKTANQWKIYGTGLPRSIVTNIFVDDYYNEIVIGTAGNGIWSTSLSDCKDVLIMQNTTWLQTDKIICGDLRIKHDVTLNITKSNITAKNIILEPGAKIIWSEGSLSSVTNNGNDSFVITSRGSIFSIQGVTINNFTVNNFENGTLETGNGIFNNVKLNIYNGSFYDNIPNTLLTLNNSDLNFYSDYYYKTHAVTPNAINSNYYSNLESINMNGNGKIKVFDNDIKIQNENLYDRISPVVNNGNYWFESNNSMRVGKYVTPSYLSGNTTANSTTNFVAKNIIIFEDGTILGPESYAKTDNSLNDNLTTPYSKFSATDINLKYDKANNKWIGGDEDEDEEHEKEKVQTSTSTDIKDVDDIRLYPNPVVSELNYQIFSKDILGKEFKLINLEGRILYTGRFSKEKGNINVNNINEKIFLLVYEDHGKLVSKKIIKQGLTDKQIRRDSKE